MLRNKNFAGNAPDFASRLSPWLRRGITVLFSLLLVSLAAGEETALPVVATGGGRPPLGEAQSQALRQLRNEREGLEQRNKSWQRYLSDEPIRQKRLDQIISVFDSPSFEQEAVSRQVQALGALAQLREDWLAALAALPVPPFPSQTGLEAQLKQVAGSGGGFDKSETPEKRWQLVVQIQAILVRLKTASLSFSGNLRGEVNASLRKLDTLKGQAILIESAPASGGKP